LKKKKKTQKKRNKPYFILRHRGNLGDNAL